MYTYTFFTEQQRARIVLQKVTMSFFFIRVESSLTRKYDNYFLYRHYCEKEYWPLLITRGAYTDSYLPG